ncbi:MAG: hypothetical protein MUE95_10830 [Cyclobacteriaceae bacterium]|jgi:hypothetical protein|nr:hypothetical protein [Cyclobacteriaceae bacterium]
MENQSLGERVMNKSARFLKRLLGVILIIAIITMAFFYWGVYERGVWAGKVLSVSQKGIIFKTYEGKISMESFGALKGTSPIAETRDFSVGKDNPELLQELEQAALAGERVNLHFIRRYMAFPWRGDTKYFVVRVER